MARTRNVDPGVGKARSNLAIAIRDERPTEEVEQVRQELYEAKIMAAAMAAAARLPDLPPEKQAIVAAAFGGGQ